ncbi:cytochrome c oxidase subunit II [Microvirga aerophila]|uniref:Cytochrome aa3 subunit 2 n=1 Tax=Microvirga aerophila TaxID=670291 RepID=A0A512BUL6_9HYPH|nr:cytochrome c oxidase subunit II [Microvirga aerophila]GEO15671.1 cytochrome c oxidase subunit II [Microvirga aerophila]
MNLETTRHRLLGEVRACVRRAGRLLLISGPLAAAAGCSGIQSALDPAGFDAQRIYVLTLVMTAGGALIFLGVTALLLYAIYAEPSRRAWLGSRRTVLYGGLAFPVVVLSALLPYGLIVMRDTDAPAPGALPIEVIGEQYWWRVRYPAAEAQNEFSTANEVVIPVGRPISISVTSADVIHSFWIPNFGGKIDMIPGRINRLNFTAERPGIYRGVCAEFCGDQHARMAFDVVALEPDAFAVWRTGQSQPAPAPPTPFLERGRDLFRTGGCGSCHAVRGTDANGQFGPDLSHVGSRRTIGAGQFPNNVGTLAGWIANTQHIKPGARMPSYGTLSGEDLRALAGYLESLR